MRDKLPVPSPGQFGPAHCAGDPVKTIPYTLESGN